MERKQIYLGNVECALRFIEKAEQENAKMKLISGSKTVDAKSLLGVFTLDFSKPIMLEVIGDDASTKQALEVVGEYLQKCS